MENVKLKKLDNGITLITENLPDISTFSMGFFVKTGAMNETKKESGISHFIEHLMFKGTKNRTAKEISEFVDFEGGILNAFTSREMTCYYIKLLSSKIDIAIDVLTDMLLNSNFDEESIEKERNVIIEEIKMYEYIPEEIVHEKNVEYALRGIHSNSISGTVASLKKIDRKAILNYLEKHYVAENLVIVASGNIDEKYLYKELNKKMKNFRKTKKEEILDLSYEIKKGKKIVKKPSNQIHLCFSTRGVSSKSDLRYPAAIISNVLGEGMSSRLFQKIREERGLAYSVYTYLTRFENCGLLSVYVGTTKEDYKEELTKKITKHVHESLNESSLRDVLKDMNIKINISFEEK